MCMYMYNVVQLLFPVACNIHSQLITFAAPPHLISLSQQCDCIKYPFLPLSVELHFTGVKLSSPRKHVYGHAHSITREYLINGLREWCLKNGAGPPIKPSRTCRVSMTTIHIPGTVTLTSQWKQQYLPHTYQDIRKGPAGNKGRVRTNRQRLTERK